MNILPRTSRFYQNLMAMLLITLITITLSFLAATVVPEARPVIHVTPDAVAMRRESLTLDEALDKSLAYGDYRRVDWSGVA